MKSLPPAHVLSGCNTVIRVLEKQPLTYPHSTMEEVIVKAPLFLSLCYGIEAGKTLSEKR